MADQSSMLTSGIDTILNCSAYFSPKNPGASAASVSDMVLTCRPSGPLREDSSVHNVLSIAVSGEKRSFEFGQRAVVIPRRMIFLRKYLGRHLRAGSDR